MLLKAIIVSIIQGIAEFLPISSSGHILLFKKIFNLDLDISYDIFIHLGTLFSIIFVYRNDIFELVTAIFYKNRYSNMIQANLNRKDYLKLYLIFFIAILPAGIVGVLFDDFIEETFSINNKYVLLFLAIFFMITAFLLFIASRFKDNKKNIQEITIKDSFVIGIFQAFAILPGISRSGSTISGALVSKVRNSDASKFSFLVGLPLIFGAFLLHLKDMSTIFLQKDMVVVYFVSFFVSFIVGVVSLKFLINIINKNKLYLFSIYLIIPSFLSLFFYFFR